MKKETDQIGSQISNVSNWARFYLCTLLLKFCQCLFTYMLSINFSRIKLYVILCHDFYCCFPCAYFQHMNNEFLQVSSSSSSSNGGGPLVVTAELANKLKSELAAQQVIHVPTTALGGVDWAAKLKVGANIFYCNINFDMTSLHDLRLLS